MIVVPFIYFTLMTLYFLYKHKALDVCVYMSGLYAFTSLCAIIIVTTDSLGEGGILFGKTDAKFNVIPTVVYCVLLTMSILPFSMIYKKDIKRITPAMPYVLNMVGIVLIGVSLLNFYLVADSTLEILSGDLSNLRTDHYSGILSPAEIKAESLPFLLKLFYYLNTSTLLALPIFFYNICFGKGNWLYNTLLFLASLSCPLVGIQTADRTEFIFYAMMFLLCLLLFGKFLSKKMKRIMIVITIPFAVAFVIYLVAVSEARFSEKVEGGASTSVLQYTGQGYINFCYFWENGKREFVAAEREFPLASHILFGVDSYTDRRDERTGQQGFFISVFATFIGDILLDIGPVGVTAWVLFYFLTVMLIIKKSHRAEFNIGEMIMIFVMAVIPVFGVFYYRYFAFTSTIMIIIGWIVYFLSKYKIKLK